MPTFQGVRSAFTPSTGSDNWTLDFGVTAGTFGKVIEIGWGGNLTTSTSYRTRWTRPTAAGTGIRTAITLGYGQPNYTSAGATLVSSYATLQPTLPADGVGNLWEADWNGQGGTGVIVLPLANPWWCVNGVLQGSISCRNLSGVDASGSAYPMGWEE